jgi:hypothetical protein
MADVAAESLRIGVLSDTHGKLRAEVLALFEGVERILHAGDVGPAELLTELEAVAPVTAVWGNADGFDVRAKLRETALLEIGGLEVVITHGHKLGAPTPRGLRDAIPGADVIVFGHSHRPLVERLEGCLFLNPGSAGAARFGLSASAAILTITQGHADAAIHTFD